MTGGFGDVGFFSFNRGKNISTAGGGCLTTDRSDLLVHLDREIDLLPEPLPLSGVSIAVKMMLLALAVRPAFYTIFYDRIAQFKYTEPHTDFTATRYLPYQARVGRILFRMFERLFQRRYLNGMFLYRALREIRGLTVPTLVDRAFPVFNQFPLLLPDRKSRDTLHEMIRSKARTESTTLYPEPIHRMYSSFWRRKGEDPFPNATQMAERLLLIPTHPLIGKDRLERVVEVIRNHI
jgi:dTDP-4-amino-4,6-dideoxygalactose transaminase